jgi:hypothetical protein
MPKELRSSRCSWRQQFPDTKFNYDPGRWLGQAMRPKGCFLDLVGNALGIDPLDMELLGGRRYFHFHAAAGKQRQTLEDEAWQLI